MEHKFFHVLGVYETKCVLPILMEKLNFLLSAYMIDRHGREVLTNTDKLRESTKCLFIDSGMIGAWKHNDLSWMNEQETVIETAKKLRADIVSMLDLPMEPRFLMANGFTQRRALAVTYQNAESFRDAGDIGIAKCFVIQGWRPDDYRMCIKQYDALRIWDDADVIGIGSVCMRTPETGLYDIAKLVVREVRKRTDASIHCFGIAQPRYVTQLYRIGVESCDSATAALSSAFFKLVTGQELRGFTDIKFKRYLFALNYYLLESMVMNEMEKSECQKTLDCEKFKGEIES